LQSLKSTRRPFFLKNPANRIRDKNGYTGSEIKKAVDVMGNFKKVFSSIGCAVTVFGLTSLTSPAFSEEFAPPPPPPIQMKLQTLIPTKIRYSDFLKMVESDDIEKTMLDADGHSLMAEDHTGKRYEVYLPKDPDLVNFLQYHKVGVSVLSKSSEGVSGAEPSSGGFLLPALLFGVVFLWIRRMLNLSLLFKKLEDDSPGPNTRNNPLMMGRTRAEVQVSRKVEVTFADVAGCDGAKRELMEVVDFMKNPTKYTDLGARVPRGVLMEGPPGTGKTLLARAVAGEAGVPFVSCTGSEFVEVFVGVGASRVRDIFGKAKKNAPCILFIDEIDAVGRMRGAGIAGGNDEREQTLNQILVEMDGFVGNTGVIVLAATNRADVLDAALLRPGRFDRRVTVGFPDFKGRFEILKVHCKGKPLSAEVDLQSIARRTPGFTGAGLQNLMNEAAIQAARAERTTILWEDIDRALDRILVGLEKKGGMERALQRKELIAFHEAGHAVVGALTPDFDCVQKITIIPRTNGAGGLTFFSPNEFRLESGQYSKQYLESQLAVALGGRIAEEIVFGESAVTTGASNDLEQVAKVAKSMVCNYGFSEKIGLVAIGSQEEEGPFQGRDMYMRQEMGWSKETMEAVDSEVERLVSNAYLMAKEILEKNKSLLYDLATRLIEQETVSAEEFALMITAEDDVYMAPYNCLNKSKSPVEKLPFNEKVLPTSSKAPF